MASEGQQESKNAQKRADTVLLRSVSMPARGDRVTFRVGQFKLSGGYIYFSRR